MKYIVFLILFSGCSLLSLEECQKMNWRDKGYQDAIIGTSTPRTYDYQKACSEHNIKIDDKKYNDGFNEGLKKFCTYDQGYKIGKKGGSHQSCEKIGNEFSQGLELGHLEYKKEVAKNNLKRRLEQTYGTDTCTFDSDCNIEGTCQVFSPAVKLCDETHTSCNSSIDCKSGFCSEVSPAVKQCSNTDEMCHFDSDCVEVKLCQQLTEATEYNDIVRVRVCTP